jgi:crotonobetainyl-CoA:carnitine CoA-transferase CaiB-like acyl-CoA transferase
MERDPIAAADPVMPLAGVRVLDLSRVLAGPWASQILGDLGAEVIKVEHPDRGDDTRAWGPPFLDPEDPDSPSAYYLSCNRNKKSVAIDIAKPAGAGLVRTLARHADIVLENFKVGGLAKYGLDYPSLRQEKADLIYCSITGFGQTGPYALRAGYDFLIQGMSGLMSITGQPVGAPGAEPMKVGVAVSDLFTGLYAAISILAALRHRDATGEGQHIDCALLDTQASVLANQAMNWLVGGLRPQPLGNKHPNVVPYQTFATRDGHVIVATGNDGQFQALCRLLQRPDLAGDPKYSTSAGRQVHRTVLEPALAETIRTWSSADFMHGMDAHGIPGGPINTIPEVFADPQIQARGLVRKMTLPDGSQIPTIAFPAILSATPASYRLAPPALGQDTREVLETLSGLAESELAALQAQGVIHAAC